jgi:hypothetical protein
VEPGRTLRSPVVRQLLLYTLGAVGVTALGVLLASDPARANPCVTTALPLGVNLSAECPPMTGGTNGPTGGSLPVDASLTVSSPAAGGSVGVRVPAGVGTVKVATRAPVPVSVSLKTEATAELRPVRPGPVQRVPTGPVRAGAVVPPGGSPALPGTAARPQDVASWPAGPDSAPARNGRPTARASGADQTPEPPAPPGRPEIPVPPAAPAPTPPAGSDPAVGAAPAVPQQADAATPARVEPVHLTVVVSYGDSGEPRGREPPPQTRPG